MSSEHSLPILMTTKAAADYLHLAPRTLCNMRSQGKGPKFVKSLDGSVRYRAADLARYAGVVDECLV